MSGFANAILGGAEKLIRKAIASPNYVAGSAGWSINKDGSAEFNNLTVRGEFDGTNYVVNKNGEFFYSGTPAAGSLGASIALTPGTDPYENNYLAGPTTYARISSTTFVALQNDGGKLTAYTAPASGSTWGAWTAVTSMNVSTTTDGYYFSSPVAAQYPGVGGGAETWHPLTLASGWANSGGGGEQAAAYRINALGDLQLTGIITGSAGTGSNTLATLPSGYIPSGGNIQAPCVVITSSGLSSSESPYLQVGTGGNLTLHGIGTAGTVKISLSAYFPLSSA